MHVIAVVLVGEVTVAVVSGVPNAHLPVLSPEMLQSVEKRVHHELDVFSFSCEETLAQVLYSDDEPTREAPCGVAARCRGPP